MERLEFPLVLLGAYILTSLVVPMIFKGTAIFLFDIAVWVTAIVLVFLSLKRSQFRLLKGNKEITTVAIVMAFSQILFPILAGLFLGFARNSVAWDLMSLTIFLPYLLASLFAIELARFYLAKMIKKNDQTLSLLLISLLCTIVSIPSYLGLASVPDILLFFLQKFIPMLAISLLATCFAFYGGFRASLAYMLVPFLFSWFSPMIPNPPWAMQTLMTIALSTTGVVILDQSTRSLKDRRISGMLERKKSHLLSWTGIAMAGLIIVWGSSGLLGVKPTIIASGSMQPNLNVGDITIIVPLAPDTIRIGDIIQYHTSETVIIHRVIAEDIQDGQLLFTTKGDANNAPDPEPVNEQQVMGKAVLTIPKIGWVSITLRDFASKSYEFLSTLPKSIGDAYTWMTAEGVYLTSALAVIALTYLLVSNMRRRGGTEA